jgi:glutathione-regulated potassium-efflux system protein KefB
LLAGVILAESEYRHELEADIELFKAILMGVFFISIGSANELGVIVDSPAQIASFVLSLLILKSAVGFVIARIAGLSAVDGSLFAMCLAQGDEFAFVLVTAATQARVLDSANAQVLSASVALSMMVAPLMIKLHSRVLVRGFWASK